MIEDGVLSYDNGDGSHTVPTLNTDGSLTIMTVLEGPAAPSTYAYDLSVPAGGEIVVADSGAAVVLDETGAAVASIDAPWATDANGKSLPTRYEVEGDSLIQVVDHSAPDVAYPVVADPKVWFEWWGQVILFSKSETKYIAGQSSAGQAVTAACFFIPVKLAAGVCTVVLSWKLGSLFAVAAEAKAQGRCLQVNIPYPIVGGATSLLINFTNVRCQA